MHKSTQSKFTGGDKFIASTWELNQYGLRSKQHSNESDNFKGTSQGIAQEKLKNLQNVFIN